MFREPLKDHSRHKYNILEKYLDVCIKFNSKYGNFCFVDLHGGFGYSSMRVACYDIPIYICEINPKRADDLKKIYSDKPNIQIFQGDCNKEIDTILNQIDRRNRFTLFFADPTGLIYSDKNGKHTQLAFETVEKIARLPRSEQLINFPWYAISRCAGKARKGESNGTWSLTEAVFNAMGSFDWLKDGYEFGKSDSYKPYLNSYERELKSYPFIKHIPIKNRNRLLYFLIFATRKGLALRIMSEIMQKEGENIPKAKPLM